MRTSIVIFVVVVLFNQALASYPIYNDLLELNAFLSRERRTVDTPCYNVGSCCSVQGFHGNTMKECMQELHIRGRPNPDQINCIADCMSKKDGYMNDKGVVDKEILRSYLNGSLISFDWLTGEARDTVVNVCVDNIDASVNVVAQCNGVGVKVGHCVAAKMQLHCPHDKEQNHEQCDALKKYIQTEGDLPPIPLRCPKVSV